jgi:hypothetical protein
MIHAERATFPRFGTALVAIALASTSYAAGRTLLPVDEAARNPGFFSFRAALISAIARRDTAAVMDAVDPHVRVSFGDAGGIAAFRSQWKLGARDSRLWDELGTLLALGGSFDASGRFVAPYVFSQWPPSIDAFDHAAMIGSGVRVRSAPRPDAPTLTSLDFAIVKLAPHAAGTTSDAWTALLLPGGRTGYVASSWIRSSLRYRAFFEKRGGRWRMTTLVSGD